MNLKCDNTGNLAFTKEYSFLRNILLSKQKTFSYSEIIILWICFHNYAVHIILVYAKHITEASISGC